MRTRTLFLAGAAALLAAAAPHAARATDWDPAKVVAPALRPIQKIEPQRKVLKNGITVFLLENHDLPVVKAQVYVKASPEWVPSGKLGLGSITGEVMRSGGTTAHPGDWLDDRLGAIGASISTAFDGRELAYSGFNCLSDNLPEVVGLWSEVLRKPAFPDDKIELSKVGLRRGIAERNDALFSILVRELRVAIYGRNSVWARYPEYATVEAVTRADCLDLYRKLFEPSRMVLAVYGDFKTADMLRMLDAKFGDWKGAGVAVPPLPPTPEDAKPRIVFAPKDDATQSGIVLAHVGFRADDPDDPAMDVYETALGGGFQSRLTNKIRSQRGLAYATGAQAGSDFTRPGLFLAYSLTKSESTMTAVDLVREEVQRSVTEPFTDEEIRLARNTVENTFVFKFEQPSDILFRAAYYQVVGYPQDYLQRYQQGLQAVTGVTVSEAARRKVHPARLVTIIVGKEKAFDRPLESAGQPVERVDITIPPPSKAPPSKTPASGASGQATPAQLEQGRKWLARAAELGGGARAWSTIKSLKLETTDDIAAGEKSLKLIADLSWRFPDHLLAVQKLPFGEARVGLAGAAGWTSMGPDVHDMPDIATDVANEWQRSLFHLFGHASEVEVRALDATETIDGVAYHVALTKDITGQDVTLYFGPDGALARVVYDGHGPNGPARLTEIFSDWRTVHAIRYPYQRQVLMDGQPYMNSSVNSIALDPVLADSLFRKPGS